MKRPPVPHAWKPRDTVDKLLLAAAVGSAITIAVLAYDKATAVDLQSRVQAVTQLAEQNQVALHNSGAPSVGPPAQSVASGKAKPPPVEVAPTTTNPNVAVSPTLSSEQESHIVNLVLAKVKVPKPTTADLSRAVVAVLKDNPSLTLSQVVTAVNSYEAKHPPAPGSPGPSGLPGSPGASGLPGIGIASLSATENTDSDPWTVTFHFTLTDGSTTDVGPLNLPSGKNGKDAPTIVSEHIANNGDGTCKTTLTMSDGSTVDSNVWACSPSPTPTATPSPTQTPS